MGLPIASHPPAIFATAFAALVTAGCSGSGNPNPPHDAVHDGGASGPPSSGGSSPTTATTAFDIVHAGEKYTATSKENAKFVIEVDCDDTKADQHEFGITPIIDGRRYEVFMWEGTFGLITPDWDAGTTRCVSVESKDKELTIHLETGSYKELAPTAADEPVPLDARFSIENGHLVAQVTGIYYVLPTAQRTTLRISAGGKTETRVIEAASPASEEYFEGVTRVEVDDAIYGSFALDTLIERLQVQRYVDGSQGFELDLDHTFKDVGQKSVSSKISF